MEISHGNNLIELWICESVFIGRTLTSIEEIILIKGSRKDKGDLEIYQFLSDKNNKFFPNGKDIEFFEIEFFIKISKDKNYFQI